MFGFDVFGRSTSTDARDSTPNETEHEEWPYLWEETEVERVEGQSVVSHGTDANGEETVFAGPAARKAMDSHRDNDDEPLWLGIGTRAGRFCGIEKDVLFRHAAVFGTTGYGKSTLLKNAAKQIAEAGEGFAMIDPKGDDSEELIEMLPEDRLEDVVWVEPSGYRSAATGFNFLDVGLEPDDPTYDIAVENVVSDLQSMLKADDWWGPLMSGVAETLIRGTSRLDYDFTLVDLYYILESEGNRQQFANLVSEEQLSFLSYTDKIAELDDDDLDAIRRRLKNWVENPIARDVIAERESKIDIEGVVSEGKILIVRMSDEDEEIKKMISTAVIRRIWASVRSRSASREDRDPFYLIADEFDIVASGNSNITTMLSKARSLRLSIILACQQPSQLPDDILSGIFGNCDTVLSFSPGNPNDARAIADNLDMPWRTLNNESNFHIWVQLTLKATRDRSDAFRTYTFPEYPPVRRRSDALHAIERACRTYGTPPKSDQEVKNELLINNGQGTLEGVSKTDDTDEADSPALVRAMALQAIYDEGYYSGTSEGFVSLPEASDRIARYVERVRDDVPDTPSKIEGLIGQFSERLLERDRRGDLRVRCTDDGKARFLSPVDEDDQEDGKINENTGGFEHAEIMRAAYDDLLEAGLPLHIVRQGGDDDPDAIAEPESAELRLADENPTLKPVEVASLVEKFRENSPLLDRLTDANGVDIEAEHSTGDTAPGVTLEHIARSLEDGRRCLLLAWPDTAESIARRLDEHPKCMRSFSGEDGAYRLYNANGDVRAGPNEVKVYRPAGGQTVWLSHENDAGIELRDSDGETLATFDDPEAVFDDPSAYPATEKDISDFSEWTTIKRPALPSRIDRDMVDVIAVTDTGLRVIEDGERIPIDQLVEGDRVDRDDHDLTADQLLRR